MRNQNVLPYITRTTLSLLVLSSAPLLARGTSDTPVLAESERKALLECFEKSLTCNVECGDACMSQGKCTSECAAAHEQRAQLTAKLVKSPEARAAMLSLLAEKWQQKETTPAIKGRMLDFLSEGQCEEGRALSAEWFQGQPELFHAQHRLAFAMAGSEVFAKAIPASFEATPCPQEKFLYAAYLASKGDKVGQGVLEASLAESCEKAGAIARAMVAAKALQKLGGQTCTVELKERAHAQALAELDAGRIDEARRIALEATLGLETIEGGWGYLPYFEQRLQWTVGFGAHKYAGADQVFSLIEHLGSVN